MGVETSLGLVPINGATQAILEAGLGMKAEQPLGPAGVYPSTELRARLAPGLAACTEPGRSVGFGGVPYQLALEAGQAGDGLGQVFDADLSRSIRMRLESALDPLLKQSEYLYPGSRWPVGC